MKIGNALEIGTADFEGKVDAYDEKSIQIEREEDKEQNDIKENNYNYIFEEK